MVEGMRHALALRAVLLIAIANAVALSACKKGGLGAGFEGEISLHTTRAGSPPVDMVVKAKKDKLRFDTTTNGQAGSAIFDPAQNKVVLVMDAQKAYMDMDFASPTAPAPNADPKTSVTDKLGTKDMVAGVECENWVVKDGSGKRSEVCIAEGIAFFDLDGLRNGSSASSWSKQMREKKLFPMRNVDFDASGKEVSRTEATKVEKKSLDDATFEVPKDYKKITLPGK